jgi:hypothetical protein
MQMMTATKSATQGVGLQVHTCWGASAAADQRSHVRIALQLLQGSHTARTQD